MVSERLLVALSPLKLEALLLCPATTMGSVHETESTFSFAKWCPRGGWTTSPRSRSVTAQIRMLFGCSGGSHLLRLSRRGRLWVLG